MVSRDNANNVHHPSLLTFQHLLIMLYTKSATAGADGNVMSFSSLCVTAFTIHISPIFYRKKKRLVQL